MSMTVACPGCTTQLALAPELLGQVLVCPHCASQFQVAAGVAAGQPPAPPVSPATPQWRGDPAVLAGGFKLNETAPPAPPQFAVPRFKPVDPSSAAVSLTQEGTLPELNLADLKAPPKTAPQTEKQPRTLALTLIVAASLTLSVCLSLIDFSPKAGDADARARFQITSFYSRSHGELEPYQLLLRGAQRAHSRGDHTTEQAKYREVLRLLRAEHRSSSLTETRTGDQELEAAIAVVLAEE